MAGSFEDLTPGGKYPDPSPLAECLDPYGLKAKCLPFTISPFALIDMCLACPDTQSKFMHEGDIILTSTLKLDLFAAFPVMIPFYAAEYTMPTTDGIPEYTYTLYVPAFEPHAKLAGLFPLPPGYKWPSAERDDNGCIDIDRFPVYETIEAVSKVPALRTDDDVCIRPFTTEEYRSVERYIDLRRAYNKLCSVVSHKQTWSIRIVNYNLSFALQDPLFWPKTAIKDYEERLEEEHRRSTEYLPSWWSESKWASPTVKKKTLKKERPLKSRSSPIGENRRAP
ncbi:hypothetical protein HYPSUDRAFT_314987 [Hypholoma sublateritium FD-334 SS-4]|uniref:Uncharacterized protein n=1 Tax=Hypholoma sublateritium (strain FD-334 SS-4) TaxID=945553 RepID=A0A0D2LFD3_HYPSF|nr:hypothetical protein HYPSUDRAFT_314987 [Hypholoma sublateritium FD-334 SS-4]